MQLHLTQSELHINPLNIEIMKYFVWSASPFGGGYLHLEGTKRVWGSYFDVQFFSKEEVDEILPKISLPFSWKCYDTAHNLYKERKCYEVYI